MEKMDLNVSHYTKEDMMKLLQLNDVTISKSAIESSANAEIKKHEKNKSIVDFYEAIKSHLIGTLSDTATPTYQVDVAKGVINPDLKNTITRFINIDSSSRMELFPNNLSSDSFTFELTEPLQNVLSMSLYSAEIPQSWYNNSVKKGTTAAVLYVTYSNGTQYKSIIQIPDGNYSPLGLVSTVESTINSLLTNIALSISYSATTGKCVFVFTSLIELPESTDILVQIVWFDSAFENEVMLQTRLNSSLGWMLGFREAITSSIWNNSTAVMVPSSIVNCSGTKYVILALNDYKTNRINRSMIGVNTHPHTTIRQTHMYNDKLSLFKTSTSRIRALHSNPRTMSDAMLQSINAVSSQVNVKNRFAQYESSDAFAKISVKQIDWNRYDTTGITVFDNNPGRLIVEAGGPLQLQSREYFGPVEITNLFVGLYDDKGNVLGLNGMDWSCTLAVKSLYQY
jgi:hypothetical protein